MLQANTGEVEAAQVAMARSINSAVTAFAMQMITDHDAANQRLQAALQSSSITAEDSALRTCRRR